jgi:TRAP transporter TAXI family solute receptor
MKILRLIYISISVFALCVTSASAIERKIIRIGSGSLLDGYYSIGLTLCRFISQANDGIKCEVVPTSGSLENIWLLQREKIDFAFTLSNLAVQSHNGTGYFSTTEPFKDMYQLLRLHDEYFTVLVKDKDKISVFGDLDGKKVSNGPPQSDSSVAYDALTAYYDFKKVPEDIEILHENYAKEFCDGKIDAIMLMTGHPDMLINMVTNKCESDFVTIEGDKIDLLTKNSPEFKKVTLKAGTYPGITEDQETVAASSILVAGKSVDKKIVKNFLDYFNSRLARFKASDPVLYDIEDSVFTSGFVIPGFNDTPK